MRFIADLHIHSKYSRACSKDCDLEHLTWWAQRKGISLVGTGDFTHPAWFAHLQENLVSAEPGLFRLRPDLDRDIARTLPPSCVADVRFMLSVEISTIYKRGDKTRKVHHLIYMPSFEAAAEFNRRLGKIGNLGSDGRPIIGLDSRDLLEITLESGAGAYLVPAHVWTPWFAVFGSKSGFDAIEECYLDLADHIFALETGLSSDPEMNWRISGLDRYRLVSNSDAHSPPALGREATVFDTDLDYFAIRRALESGHGFGGSIEFFPEEGKYHLDGHRKCDVCFGPAETLEHKGRCPVCGKPLTVGVLNRIQELADRPEGYRLQGAADYRSLIPLPEIMGEILGVGPKSKKVLSHIDALTAQHGPELHILNQAPIDDLSASSPLLGEAISRLRQRQVIRESGYDGEYGTIRLFEPGEITKEKNRHTSSLFDDSLFTTAPAKPVVKRHIPTPAAPETPPAESPQPAITQSPPADSLLDKLDPDQRKAAEIESGPLLIIAGPGTGKTRTLTHRIAHLVTSHQAAPRQCLAITFTRRAATEMFERLTDLLGDQANQLTVTTFHALGVMILRDHHERIGLSADFTIVDQSQQLTLLTELTGDERTARRAADELSRSRRSPHEASADALELLDHYTKALRKRDSVDFDDLVALPVELLESDTALADNYRQKYPWISVDEYQDVDETQYRLLRLLTTPQSSLTVIGDPDQAIYRFRGADVGFFLRFQQDFPTATTVQLTRNYRSSKHILHGALQAITPTALVTARLLTPAGSHTAHELIGVHQAATAQAEAAFVARTIDQLLGGFSFHSIDSGRVHSDGTQGLSFSDFAVLYRTNSQAKTIMEALTRSGVPFQKRSHDRLTDRPGVADIMRELNFMDTAGGEAITERLRRAVVRLLNHSPQSDKDEHAADIYSALELLTPLAQQHGSDLAQFRTELALGAEVDTWDPRADRVSLLTLHAAKGLEFPVVFLVGCEDGLLPLRWPGNPAEITAEELAEERRLFFVGMTRAEQHLYLSYSAERAWQGAPRKTTPTPFLRDIDSSVREQLGQSAPRQRKAHQLRLL